MKRTITCLAVLLTLATNVAGLAETPDRTAVGERARAAAKDILEANSVKGGLIVKVGLAYPTGPAFKSVRGKMQTGELAIALRAGDAYIVHGLDGDAANVKAARALAERVGAAGAVSFSQLTGGRLPYADNTVNLLVSLDLGKVPMSEVMRVLVPLGTAQVGVNGQWKLIRKPWPKAMDEWTHFLHGPDNNAVGKDMLVGPPRRIQWSAGPLWSRHHNLMPSTSVMVSSAGRVFYIEDEAPPAMTGDAPDQWWLVARDGFNGVELWRKPIADWGWRAWADQWEGRFNQPNEITKRLVAAGDKVYATLGFNAPLVCLDAATGKLLRTYEGTNLTDEIVHIDGKLLLSLNHKPQRAGQMVPDPNRPNRRVFVGLDKDPPVRKSVALLDAATGETLWKVGDFVGTSTKTGPLERETHLLLCARGPQAFLLDRREVVSLDLKTGKELWRGKRRENPVYTSRYYHKMSDMCTLVAGDGVVVLTQFEPIQKRIGWRVIKAGTRAFDSKSGRRLWDHKSGSWAHFSVPDTFIANGLVWLHDPNEMSIMGLEPRTGAEKRRISTEPAFDNGHHHRCYRNKATEKYLVTSFRGYEFIDWKTGEVNRNHWVRGTCRLGAMPCNGLLYTTAHPCDCYISSLLRGMLAIAPAGDEPPVWDDAARLVRGEAWGQISDGSRGGEEAGSGAGKDELAKGKQGGRNGVAMGVQATAMRLETPADAWPMYRHDAARSGHTAENVPAALKQLWITPLSDGRLSAPTCAGGVVVTAESDGCAVRGCDAATGRVLWTCNVGGQVDTPPTLWRGLAIFGCRDGWIYCVRSDTGRAVWRFLAAPAERLVGSFGRLESAWPVNGSVIVRDGKVFATAGRSSFLDGGIMAWCLDAATGRIIERHRVASEQNMKVDHGREVQDDYGTQADLLVDDGNSVYMRNYVVFGRGEKKSNWGSRLGATGGMLDDSWFNRMFWILDGKLQGESLVYDATRVYSVRAFSVRGHQGFIDVGKTGYTLAGTNRTPPIEKVGSKAKRRKVPYGWPEAKPADEWDVHISPRIRAMALAGGTLFCAGTPDVLDPKQPWADYESKRDGVLMVVSAASGKVLAEHKLPAAPVQDGIAVAGGRVYVSLADGSLMCFGAK